MKKNKNSKVTSKVFWYLTLSLGALTMLLPFLWMISTSLKAPGEIFSAPLEFLPHKFQWDNYIKAWNAIPFGRFYINSIVISVAQTAGVLTTSSMAAYFFARLKFPGKNKIFFAYLATLMIPGAVTMIPNFVLMRMLNWTDTYYALIVPGIFTAYGTFMLRQFFLGIPPDLEEAARIDGCNKLGIYFHVILPLAKPALATLGTFTFIGSWNSFMWPLIIINSTEKKTLPIGLASFQSEFATDWNLLMAASIIVMGPAMVVFLFNQKFFVSGIKLSGIKG